VVDVRHLVSPSIHGPTQLGRRRPGRDRGRNRLLVERRRHDDRASHGPEPDPAQVSFTSSGEVETETVALDAGDAWSRRVVLDDDFDIEVSARAIEGGPITCETTEPGREMGETTGDAGRFREVRCSLSGEVDGNVIRWQAEVDGSGTVEAAEATATTVEHEWCAVFAGQRVEVAVDWATERRALETDDSLELRLAFLERNLDDNDCDRATADAILCDGLTDATAGDANLGVWLGGTRDDACQAAA